MHVVLVGQVCIDTNVSEHAKYTAAGGPPIFMSKVFSQIPEVTSINVTPYGKDFLLLKQKLPLFPNRPTSDTTLVYENVVKNNVRKRRAYHREKATPIPADEELEKLLTLSDIVILAPLLPNFSPAYVQAIIATASENALKVLLPQGYYRGFTDDDVMEIRSFEEAEKILPLFDMVIVSDQDGKDMLTTAKGWSQEYSLLGIVTLGEKGALAFEKGKEIFLPTTPVPQEKVIDSIGSGEIFSASLAYAYKKTGDIVIAGRFANAVARSCLFYTPDEIQLDISLIKLLA